MEQLLERLFLAACCHIFAWHATVQKPDRVALPGKSRLLVHRNATQRIE